MGRSVLTFKSIRRASIQNIKIIINYANYLTKLTMAKSESTKKLSSSFSMDNILGSQPEEESQQQQPPRLGSTSPILGTQVPGYPGMDLTNHGQLSPSSSS